MATTTFTSLKLVLKKDGQSWYIAGYKEDQTFQLLGVLDVPITLEIARKVVKLLAAEFEAKEIIEEL